MSRKPLANDNTEDVTRTDSRDAEYVRDRILELMCELEDEGISHLAVTSGTADAITDFVPGDLNCDASGEGDLWSGVIDLEMAATIIKGVQDQLEAKALAIDEARPGIRLYQDVGIYPATHKV